ncbi:MAG: hypothetical protein Q9221_006027 [Calogaya cf. arnoldii]
MNLVEDIYQFINGLEAITDSVEIAIKRAALVRVELSTVEDPEDLVLITEACADGNQQWSDAASIALGASQGLNWQTIAETYFPQKTANARRKRYEQLMEKRNNIGDWNDVKFVEVARAYREVRKDMWRILADRVNEKWSVVESKCMERGLKNLASKSHLR